MHVTPRQTDVAERIIKTQGMTFALAVMSGSAQDLREARQMLKDAIVTALAEEIEAHLERCHLSNRAEA